MYHGPSAKGLDDKRHMDQIMSNKMEGINDDDEIDDEIVEHPSQMQELIDRFAHACMMTAEEHVENGTASKEFQKKIEAIAELQNVRVQLNSVDLLITSLISGISVLPHARLEIMMKDIARTKVFRMIEEDLKTLAERMSVIEDVWNDMIVKEIPLTREKSNVTLENVRKASRNV